MMNRPRVVQGAFSSPTAPQSILFLQENALAAVSQASFKSPGNCPSVAFLAVSTHRSLPKRVNDELAELQQKARRLSQLKNT
jgi:hypothetical protein